jgi:hypothetical protein
MRREIGREFENMFKNIEAGKTRKLSSNLDSLSADESTAYYEKHQ